MEEKIVLQSLDYSPAAITPPDEEQRVIDKKILSRGNARSVRLCHKLFNVRFIETEKTIKNTEKSSDIAYFIGFLNPDPVKKWHFSKVTLALLLVVVCFLGGTLFAQQWLIAAALFLSLGLLGYRLFLSLEKQVFFKTVHGEAPLLFLSYKNKSAASVDEFIALLAQRISKNPMPESVNVLPEETKLLRRFFEAGFFSKEEYEFHRDKIFSRYPSKNHGQKY